MLQTQYPTSPHRGFSKKHTTSRTKDVIQKPCTRLCMGRPSYHTISTTGLTIPSLQKVVDEHTGLYNTLLEHNLHVTSLDTDIFCNRYVSVHHPKETGQSHSFGILYSCTGKQLDETLFLYIQHQYPEFIYYDMRFEDSWAYVEGLDSIVLDRSTKTMYAYLSSKTYYWKLLQLHKALGYKLQLLGYSGKEEQYPYTSYLMAVGETWAVICTEILGDYYKKTVLEQLQKTKTVIEINSLQLHNHCAGILEAYNQKGVKYTLMSSRAYAHFTLEQRQSFQNIVHLPLDTIEAMGGSVRRCIMEI